MLKQRLNKWIETQHGSAGWEMKLLNFVEGEIESRDKWWKDRLKILLKGCEEYNGLPYCKCCGLSDEFINDDYDKWLKKEQTENRIIEKNL